MPRIKPVQLPADLATVSAVFDGSRWLHGIVLGSLTEDDETGTVSFVMLWSGQPRYYTLARGAIAGYEQRHEST